MSGFLAWCAQLLLLSAFCVLGTGAAEYNESEAIRSLYLAKVAYCAPALIQSWTCPASSGHLPSVRRDRIFVLQNETTDLLAYIVRLEDIEQRPHCAVVFRGTISIKNWLLNLELGQLGSSEICEDCRIEVGFWKAYKSLEQQLLDGMTTVGCGVEHRPIVRLTGHSLGAALVTLTAFRFAGMGVQMRHVYTFGSPRVGDINFANAYNARVVQQAGAFRVVNYRDVAPHVPFTGAPGFGTGFHHVAQEVYYEKPNTYGPGTYKLCDMTGEDPTCSKKWSFLFSAASGGFSMHCNYMGLHICHTSLADELNREYALQAKGRVEPQEQQIRV